MMTMMTIMTTEEVNVDKDATEVDVAMGNAAMVNAVMVNAVMDSAVEVDAEDLAHARTTQLASS